MCSTLSLSILSLTPSPFWPNPFMTCRKSLHPHLVLFFPMLLAFSAEEGHFREPAGADSLTRARGHLCSRCTGAWELPLVSLPP